MIPKPTVLLQLWNGLTIVSLVVAEKILQYTQPLAFSLQKVDTELLEAKQEAENVIETLQKMRNDQKWESLYQEAETLTSKVNSTPRVPRMASKLKHRSNPEHDSIPQYWKRALYFPFIDHVINELQSRLVIPSPFFEIEKFLPQRITSSSDLQSSILTPYEHDLPDLSTVQTELERWKSLWIKIPKNERPKGIVETLRQSSWQFYPNITTALKRFATLPVSTATVERSFSTMRRLKTYLRNRTSTERMTSLALMHIYREMNVDYNLCLQQFAADGPRRILLAFDQ